MLYCHLSSGVTAENLMSDSHFFLGDLLFSLERGSFRVICFVLGAPRLGSDVSGHGSCHSHPAPVLGGAFSFEELGDVSVPMLMGFSRF